MFCTTCLSRQTMFTCCQQHLHGHYHPLITSLSKPIHCAICWNLPLFLSTSYFTTDSFKHHQLHHQNHDQYHHHHDYQWSWSLSLQLTTLNAAVKAAGLEATLASPGKFDFEINTADMRTSSFNTCNRLLKSSCIWRTEKRLSIHRELMALSLSFSFAGPFTVFDGTFTFFFVSRPFHSVCSNQPCLWEDPIGWPSGDPIMW